MPKLTYEELERRVADNERQIAELTEIVRTQAHALSVHYQKLAKRLPVHPALGKAVDELIASTGVTPPKRVKVHARYPDDPKLSPEATRERQLRRRR